MNIAICGATGAVGQEIVSVLHTRKVAKEASEITLFASSRSAGKEVETPYGDMTIEEFSLEAVKDFDVVFLCVSGDFSKEFGPTLAEQNKMVIDNSSAFRYDDATPLVVPEINAEAMKGKNFIANPNCTTAILLMPLYPIYKEFGLKRVIVSTYQATSGAGQEGMSELRDSSKAYLDDDEQEPSIFQYPIGFNIIPHIDAPQENGYTKEEMKVTWETQKIFDDEKVDVSCTAVRIPAFRAHSESVTVETEKEVDLAKVRELLTEAEGVEVVDDLSQNKYPMPLTATGKYDVEVGRIRKSLVFGENGLDFFVSGDQLLRGAALNAVLIAEAKLKE